MTAVPGDSLPDRLPARAIAPRNVCGKLCDGERKPAGLPAVVPGPFPDRRICATEVVMFCSREVIVAGNSPLMIGLCVPRSIFLLFWKLMTPFLSGRHAYAVNIDHDSAGLELVGTSIVYSGQSLVAFGANSFPMVVMIIAAGVMYRGARGTLRDIRVWGIPACWLF